MAFKKYFLFLKGFGIIEIIVAMGIFLIIVTSGATIVIQQFNSNRLGQEETEATLFAQEGIEAARSIKNQDWANLTTGTHGLDNSGGSWVLSGTSNTTGKFTREVIIENVERNIGGDIVTSGGTFDPDTFKITSSVNWDFTSSRNNTVDVLTYLTNFSKTISLGGWASPIMENSLDLTGNENGLKVSVLGSYAYVARDNNSPGLNVVDITAIPASVGSLNLDGKANNIFTSGSHAYLATESDSREMDIIDISAPTSPSLTGSFDASHIKNANGIYVDGSYAYLVRDRDGKTNREEFFILDISTPSSPNQTGVLNLSGNAYEVYISGDYAYVASSDDAKELIVIDIANKSSPNEVASINLSGNSNALTVAGYGNYIFLGRSNGDVAIIDVTYPTSPNLVATFDAGEAVNDITTDSSNNLLFLGTDNTTNEFQVVNVTAPNTPTLFGSVDLVVNSDLKGVFYDSGSDRVIAVGDGNTNEVIIFAPQ